VFGTKGKNGLSIVVLKSLGLILLAARTVAAIPAVSVSASSAVLRELVAFMLCVFPFVCCVPEIKKETILFAKQAKSRRRVKYWEIIADNLKKPDGVGAACEPWIPTAEHFCECPELIVKGKRISRPPHHDCVPLIRSLPASVQRSTSVLFSFVLFLVDHGRIICHPAIKNVNCRILSDGTIIRQPACVFSSNKLRFLLHSIMK
jgi:hypothetical protein